MQTTPVGIIESFFRTELLPKNLPRFHEVGWDEWIAFARTYQQTMSTNLLPELLGSAAGRTSLYLEPRLRHEWGSAAERRFAPTPLLGVRSKPAADDLEAGAAPRILHPLNKHLLMTDTVVVPDNFFFSFDRLAETTFSIGDPNGDRYAEQSIRAIVDWLPILAELRPLITSGALVFLPSFLAPSFPYAGNAPAIKSYRAMLKMRPGASQTGRTPLDFKPLTGIALQNELEAAQRRASSGGLAMPDPERAMYNEEEVIGAWLNARVLGLDAMFPTEAMSAFAARLYFDEGSGSVDITGDTLTLTGLPLRDKPFTVDELMTLRKGDDVFNAVKRAIGKLKGYLETQPPTTNPDRLSDLCHQFLEGELRRRNQRSKVSVLQATVPGLAFSFGVGVMAATAAPIVGVLASVVLTPKTFQAIQAWRDPERKAIARLQAVL